MQVGQGLLHLYLAERRQVRVLVVVVELLRLLLLVIVGVLLSQFVGCTRALFAGLAVLISVDLIL